MVSKCYANDGPFPFEIFALRGEETVTVLLRSFTVQSLKQQHEKRKAVFVLSILPRSVPKLTHALLTQHFKAWVFKFCVIKEDHITGARPALPAEESLL